MVKFAFAVMFLVLGFSLGFAQTNEPIFEEFQFNFVTPGARANAMGGAFIGRADDATAALTNPAGLVILTKPEVSLEYKNIDYDVERTVEADLTQTPQFFRNDTFGESVNSLSFLSYVQPVGAVSIAVFRQEYLNYEESYSLQLRKLTQSNFQAEDGDADFLGENYGFSLAYRVSPKFHLGGSIRLSRLSVDYTRTFETGRTNRIDETDSGVGISIGAMINPGGAFSVGAVYEYNPKFEFTETTDSEDFLVTIDVPDRFGVGVSGRPVSTLTLVGDVVFVRYSQLADNMTIINALISPESFSIDNAVELHLGAEKAFRASENSSVFIRGGFFTNPTHDLNFTNSGLSQIADEVADFQFNQERDASEVGYSFGGGVNIKGSAQIDAAYVISDPFDAFSLSFVLKF